MLKLPTPHYGPRAGHVGRHCCVSVVDFDDIIIDELTCIGVVVILDDIDGDDVGVDDIICDDMEIEESISDEGVGQEGGRLSNKG